MDKIKNYFIKIYPQLWTKRAKIKNYFNIDKSTEKFIELLDFKKGELFLEVGAGEGRIAKRIKKGVNYVGIDISKKLLLETKGKFNKNHFFICADAENLPFKDGVFGKAGCFATFFFIKGREELIKEVLRVLKKGGNFVLESRNTLNPKILFLKLQKEAAMKKQVLDNIYFPERLLLTCSRLKSGKMSIKKILGFDVFAEKPEFREGLEKVVCSGVLIKGEKQ